MDEDKMFEFMTKMYAEMQQGFQGVNKQFGDVNKRFEGINKQFEGVNKQFKDVNNKLSNIENRLDGVEGEVKKLGAKIDGPINDKLKALFDGYTQNTEKLTRIEQEVSKHEEVILRRIK